MRKKLLAIIAMAAMVMTMVPSMAFADTVVSGWSNANVAGNRIKIGVDGSSTYQFRGDQLTAEAKSYELIVDLSENYKYGELFCTSLGFGTGEKADYSTEFLVCTQKTNEGFEITAGVAPGEKITIKDTGVYTYKWTVSKKDGKVTAVFSVPDAAETDETLNFTVAEHIDALNSSECIRYMWVFGRYVNGEYKLDRPLILYTTKPVDTGWTDGDGYGVAVKDGENVRIYGEGGSELSGPFIKPTLKDTDLSHGFGMSATLDFSDIKAGEKAAFSFGINGKDGEYADEAFVKFDCNKDGEAMVSMAGGNSRYDKTPLFEEPITADDNVFDLNASFWNNNGKLQIDYYVNGVNVRSWTSDVPYSEVTGPRYAWAFACTLESGILVNSTPSATTFNHTNYAKAVPAKEATCTEDGNIAYWYCNYCNKYFSDEAMTKEIAKEDIVTKALGHNFKDDKCTVCGVAEDNAVQTGDNTNILIPAAVALAALLGLSGVVVARRRHN